MHAALTLLLIFATLGVVVVFCAWITAIAAVRAWGEIRPDNWPRTRNHR